MYIEIKRQRYNAAIEHRVTHVFFEAYYIQNQSEPLRLPDSPQVTDAGSTAMQESHSIESGSNVLLVRAGRAYQQHLSLSPASPLPAPPPMYAVRAPNTYPTK